MFPTNIFPKKIKIDEANISWKTKKDKEIDFHISWVDYKLVVMITLFLSMIYLVLKIGKRMEKIK
jgi:hypothetical protein